MLTIYVRDRDTGSVALLVTEVSLQVSCLLDQAGNFICVCVRITHELHQHLE